MKKIYALLIFVGFSLALSAQVVNRTETDCNGNTQSIHGVLATGKSLIVASEGLDCTICQNKASGLQTWAANNKNSVVVWAAITFTYSNNVPDCSGVQNWVSTYSWTDIFSFIDSNEFYFDSGTPIYWVYNPSDSTRSGPYSSESQAYQLALSQSNVGPITVKDRDFKKFSFRMINGQLMLSNLPAGKVDIQLVSLTGQLSKTLQAYDEQIAIDISDLTKGIYLLRLNSGANTITRKLVKE